MKSGKQAIEAIALRRATLVDPDKVRYRVYSTPTEFIAVIAESALMAVKVSGIAKPHRIVRDLPTAGASVTAQNISPPNHEAARVPLPTQMTEKKAIHVAPHEVAKKANPDEQFQPLDMRDLQKKSSVRARILSPQMLTDIIEQHVQHAPPLASGEAAARHDTVATPNPAIDTTQITADSGNLSPEEVEKLLHG